MDEKLTSFTKEVDKWIEDNCPKSMRTPMPAHEQVWASSNIKFPNADSKKWFDAMVSKGWCTPEWPVKFGGGGLSFEESQILSSRLKFFGCRPAQINFGISMLGPVILEFGTEDQKEEFLPKIARGEIWWCQGFSEPGAGSDLAGLSTTATTRNSEEYLINGSKIWTSEADKADWMYCLVKTNKTKKHDGISFVLIDMKQDEISTSRIQLISGVSPFCQVFFDDAKALKSHCIGGENKGWPVAKSLLMHERTMMSDMESEGAIDISPVDLLNNCSEFADKKLLRNEITKHELRNELIDLTMQRVKEESQFGFSEAALTLKYLSTEELQLRWELNIKSLGMGGLLVPGKGSEVINDVVKSFFYSKAYTIAGGSSEVQLNIISKNILGLPS